MERNENCETTKRGRNDETTGGSSGILSIGFLYLVDVKKSRIECDEFVMAEADRKVFGGDVQ